MTLKVGLPRSLLFYKYFPLWKTFQEALGTEIVISPATNRVIASRAAEIAEGELCVPVKMFFGHVEALKDKVDVILIPRMVSVEKRTYTCPKFLGIPDMVAATCEGLPEIIAPTFNLRLKKKEWRETVLAWGRRFSDDEKLIWAAWKKAEKAQETYDHWLLAGNTPFEHPDLLDDKRKPRIVPPAD